MTAFWDIAPEMSVYFTSTRLHGAISQEDAIFILAAVRI
jgi:hypothetical protein